MSLYGIFNNLTYMSALQQHTTKINLNVVHFICIKVTLKRFPPTPFAGKLPLFVPTEFHYKTNSERITELQ